MLYQLSYSGASAMVRELARTCLAQTRPVICLRQGGHMEHPKAVGDRTTLATMLALHAAGYTVYVPFGENTRCDLIIDDGFRLARVQCKTGRLREGAVRFSPCSSYAHHPNPRAVRRDYVGDIDYFAVHCPETSGVYLVPIGDVPTVKAMLRVAPARNSQRKKIRDAGAYEIGRVSFDGGRPRPG